MTTVELPYKNGTLTVTYSTYDYIFGDDADGNRGVRVTEYEVDSWSVDPPEDPDYEDLDADFLTDENVFELLQDHLSSLAT